jgi:WhiB family redox-sensing transcriptional regulator
VILPRRSLDALLGLASESRIDVAGIAKPPPWTEQAVCSTTDPELFFPEKGGSSAAAIRICGGCPVRTKCLEYALANSERFGIWGGMSERPRRKLQSGGAA